eukprot:1304771-Karenia_brevis.AAC.1
MQGGSRPQHQSSNNEYSTQPIVSGSVWADMSLSLDEDSKHMVAAGQLICTGPAPKGQPRDHPPHQGQYQVPHGT